MSGKASSDLEDGDTAHLEALRRSNIPSIAASGLRPRQDYTNDLDSVREARPGDTLTRLKLFLTSYPVMPPAQCLPQGYRDDLYSSTSTYRCHGSLGYTSMST